MSSQGHSTLFTSVISVQWRFSGSENILRTKSFMTITWLENSVQWICPSTAQLLIATGFRSYKRNNAVQEVGEKCA